MDGIRFWAGRRASHSSLYSLSCLLKRGGWENGGWDVDVVRTATRGEDDGENEDDSEN